MDSGEVVARVRRITWIGLSVNVGLTAFKGLAGLACSSQALVADAVHSLSDLLTDVAVIVGVRYWEAPADEEHPYGHGKIQALVTLFIALALGVVAWELGLGAVRTLASGARSGMPGLAAVGAALFSVVAKEILFHWTRRVARAVHSPALEANAWHHRSDALSSVPVVVALLVGRVWPSLWWTDAAGALLVSMFIAHVVWELAHPALQELVDAGIDDKSRAVQAIAVRVPGVQEVHRCRARRYGGAFQADLHIQVNSGLTIGEAHAIGHSVKDALVGAGIGVTDAVIHVEPRDVRAIVSLGSNIEPRAEYLARALEALTRLPCTHLVQASPVAETEPVDVPSEFAAQKFLNQVAVFETALEPHEFSRRMHAIEAELGRVRKVRNGPRTVDIDLIDFGGIQLCDAELTLPHPRARQRAFVVDPLREMGVAF